MPVSPPAVTKLCVLSSACHATPSLITRSSPHSFASTFSWINDGSSDAYGSLDASSPTLTATLLMMSAMGANRGTSLLQLVEPLLQRGEDRALILQRLLQRVDLVVTLIECRLQLDQLRGVLHRCHEVDSLLLPACAALDLRDVRIGERCELLDREDVQELQFFSERCGDRRPQG